MKEEAEKAGVAVLMGYNKNVCKYVRKTREFAETVPGSHVTFVSNNAYENTPESLGECFERNAEGMLKNMAIHELALLVSFYDVTVENIESVTADKEFSSMQTLPGPSGKEFTDFDKIKFTIKTKTGKEVSVAANRCGGTDGEGASGEVSHGHALLLHAGSGLCHGEGESGETNCDGRRGGGCGDDCDCGGDSEGCGVFDAGADGAVEVSVL